MRTPSHPSIDNLSLERVLYALSDPVRLELVKNLDKNGEQPCGSLYLKVAKSTASYHFKVLREAGIIRMEPQGTHLINSLRKSDLDHRFPGLLDAVLKSYVCSTSQHEEILNSKKAGAMPASSA